MWTTLHPLKYIRNTSYDPKVICPRFESTKLPFNIQDRFRCGRNDRTGSTLCAVDAREGPASPVEASSELILASTDRDSRSEKFEVASEGMLPMDSASTIASSEITAEVIGVISL